MATEEEEEEVKKEEEEERKEDGIKGKSSSNSLSFSHTWKKRIFLSMLISGGK